MNRKISLGVAITFMSVIITITFSVTMLFSKREFNQMIADSTKQDLLSSKVKEMDKLLANNFLFGMDNEAMIDALATGLVAGLNDPYASYFTKQQYERIQLENKGELLGIGVTVKRDADSGYLMVMEVYPDSPAALAGIQRDDAITTIDGTDISPLKQDAALALMQGAAGTRVALVLKRGAEDVTLEMQRKQIEVPSIKSKMVGEFGVVRILHFNDATPIQFTTAIEELRKEGAVGLVFDLRDNSGGTLDSVVEMLDYLLPQGMLATQTNPRGEELVIAQSDANYVDLPMVTITNGQTASAAELFVIALKDFEKAKSVGTKTFGKGVMQTTYTLSDGSAVRFTTAYFNPPKSKNFNGEGIAPDYEVTLASDTEKNIDLLAPELDLQLTKAIDVLLPQVGFVGNNPLSGQSTSSASLSESTAEEANPARKTAPPDASSSNQSEQ